MVDCRYIELDDGSLKSNKHFSGALYCRRRTHDPVVRKTKLKFNMKQVEWINPDMAMDDPNGYIRLIDERSGQPSFTVRG